MSEAVKQIVEAYVGLNNREGLEEIRAHRQKLRKSLQQKAGGWFDVSKAIRACDEDMRSSKQVWQGLATLTHLNRQSTDVASHKLLSSDAPLQRGPIAKVADQFTVFPNLT